TAKTSVFVRGTFSPLGKEGRDGPHSQNVWVRSRNFLSPWERRTRRTAQPKRLCSIEELSLPLGEKDATGRTAKTSVFDRGTFSPLGREGRDSAKRGQIWFRLSIFVLRIDSGIYRREL